jgi:diguanylate cyclase (GGDEF)-like protein/PAS domain S-box-containing protein
MVGTVHDITQRKRAEEKLRESEKRFRSLTQNALGLITIFGEDGTIRYESPAVERILGYRPEEQIGKNGFDYVHPDDKEQMKETFVEALDNPGQVQPSVEFRLRHKDSSWRHVEVIRTNLLEDPAVKGVVANSRDITERRQTEEKLRESEERYRTVVEQRAESIYLYDSETKEVLESNTALQEMLGYTTEELCGMPIYDFIADEEENIDRNVQRDLKEERRHKGERKYCRKDGSVIDVDANATVISYGGRDVVCMVVRDITERKELEEQLRHRAFHDSLTELPNRSLFLSRLEHALARTQRGDDPVAVLFVDLDDFKVVNDSLGHGVGNAVLIEVGKCLRACVRPGDTVGRIFGDEFAVLLEAPAGVEEASQVAERIQERLQESLEIDGHEVFLRASIGSPSARPRRTNRKKSCGTRTWRCTRRRAVEKTSMKCTTLAWAFALSSA